MSHRNQSPIYGSPTNAQAWFRRVGWHFFFFSFFFFFLLFVSFSSFSFFFLSSFLFFFFLSFFAPTLRLSSLRVGWHICFSSFLFTKIQTTLLVAVGPGVCMSDLGVWLARCMFNSPLCSRLQQGSYTGYFALCTVSEETSLLMLCQH